MQKNIFFIFKCLKVNIILTKIAKKLNSPKSFDVPDVSRDIDLSAHWPAIHWALVSIHPAHTKVNIWLSSVHIVQQDYGLHSRCWEIKFSEHSN